MILQNEKKNIYKYFYFVGSTINDSIVKYSATPIYNVILVCHLLRLYIWILQHTVFLNLRLGVILAHYPLEGSWHNKSYASAIHSMKQWVDKIRETPYMEHITDIRFKDYF